MRGRLTRIRNGIETLSASAMARSPSTASMLVGPNTGRSSWPAWSQGTPTFTKAGLTTMTTTVGARATVGGRGPDTGPPRRAE
jgi:hypothetical protein